MFIPEYSITSEILKNISSCEYNKAIIENLTVLPSWEKQLRKEAQVRIVKHTLSTDGYFFEEETIKKFLDNISKNVSQEIKNFSTILQSLDALATHNELDEIEIKEIHKNLAKGIINDNRLGKYRSNVLEEGVTPEVILASVVELFDWYNSLDAHETHPIISSGIMMVQLLNIKPFNVFNSSVATLTSRLSLKIKGYGVKDYYAFEEYMDQYKIEKIKAIRSTDEGDLTNWLEFYTDIFAREFSNIKEKVLLLAKDTKLAKASGRVALTERQESIVTFLQDYGILQNKAFPKLFPDVSEDTILRDIKILIDMGIVVKKGRTKSSRYELK